VDTIISVNPEQRTATVLLRVNPRYLTTINSITVRGNAHIKASTIQNSILMRPGQPFRYSQYAESQRNL
jgi:outer membrane protein assembly factor BamA